MRSLTILSILFITLSISLTSCFKDLFCETGEGEIVTVELDLDDFDAINAIGANDIVITQGESQFVEAKGHENIIDRLETFVSGGTWDIKLEDEFCYTDYDLTIYIQVPNIEEITVTGSADIIVEDFIDQESMELNIFGSGDIEFNEFTGCQELSVDITGSGDIEFKDDFGSLRYLEIDIAGSGNFKGYRAETEECDIKISGSGDCKVNVSERLNIRISGSGDIYYKGNPVITTEITGSGDIVDAN